MSSLDSQNNRLVYVEKVALLYIVVDRAIENGMKTRHANIILNNDRELETKSSDEIDQLITLFLRITMNQDRKKENAQAASSV